LIDVQTLKAQHVRVIGSQAAKLRVSSNINDCDNVGRRRPRRRQGQR
jgi:hypothetical protein